jgi:small-conductance mechanosensitive channel
LRESLRTMVATLIDIVGVVTIAILLFGQPTQFGTALGLIGAGLTVALKDFVVGFVGWFMLMGRRGIRVGDWVEIDGVRGQVNEIGLFRTIVLETGNWTESGHPTGRSVSFPNTFAIEGHFFNFTTEGQWLWDELRANLPAGRDFHAIAESIRKRASTVTADAARGAEKEWSGAGSDAMRSFSAEPAVSLRPGPAGMEVLVRYVTRAPDRNDVRARLFQELVAAIDDTAPKPSAA